ncbi:Uncharacterised protein [Klebsiella pneumoniae]|uniref:Uncharacterized protein n=1 Tax=Klebsiella pneumoniae TaxID=573 RepID=A0A377TP56_KLEPN|nr:Uncharacterised protein [Klebsiella pneumoniae]
MRLIPLVTAEQVGKMGLPAISLTALMHLNQPRTVRSSWVCQPVVPR